MKSIADKDSRVLLYSQDNQGVAVARNVGLKHASGRFIAWCDSDDWVEQKWLTDSYNHLKKYNADIAVCRCKVGNRIAVHDSQKVEVWEKNEAINKFLEHRELNGSLCNKLFKKELFGEICFDSNISYFEDDRVFWDILKKVDRIVRYHKENYHITLRQDSLTAKKFNKKRIDAMRVWKQIYLECQTSYQQYEEAASKILAYQYFCMLLAMFKDDFFDKTTENEAKRIMWKHARHALGRVEGVLHKVFYVVILFNGKVARNLYCRKR